MASSVAARFRSFADSDLVYSFRRSKVTVVAAIVLALMVLGALFAPLIAPHDPFDIAKLNLLDSELPPAWMEGSNPAYWLGTDTQARDVFSSILYGLRISLLSSASSVFAFAPAGVLLAGFGAGGAAFFVAAAGALPSSMRYVDATNFAVRRISRLRTVGFVSVRFSIDTMRSCSATS